MYIYVQKEGVSCVSVIVEEIRLGEQSSNSGEAVYILLGTSAFGNGMNSSLPHPTNE